MNYYFFFFLFLLNEAVSADAEGMNGRYLSWKTEESWQRSETAMRGGEDGETARGTTENQGEPGKGKPWSSTARLVRSTLSELRHVRV